MAKEHGGYIGKILFVDLKTRKIVEEMPDPKLYKDFIGGYGLGAKILYDRQKPKVDPLGPDSFFGFVTGPLTGTPAITGSRWAVVGKSPLTGTFGDSNGGGYFGPALKRVGFDGVFFSGISDRPVFLFINDGKSEIRDATELWGKDTEETDKLLKGKMGKGAEVACIGQGGENISLISGVVHDGGRIAARSGLGAIMGSKKLKALVVQGDMEIPIKDKDRANELRKKYLEKARGGLVFKSLNSYGTCNSTPGSILCGDASIKNWSGVAAKDYPVDPQIVGGENITKNLIRKYGCYRCPIACGGKVKLVRPPYQDIESHKPEYETLATFGPNCLNQDAESIQVINYLCNIYGLDTLSAGATIAFAMECYEKGIITKEDTGGIDLTWGNPEAMIRLVQLMAMREGFGAVLADGCKLAAERIGKGSEQYAMHVRGEGMPMHGARYSPGYAVQWTMDATPARHTVGGYAFVERYSKFLVGLDGLPQEFNKYVYTGRGEWAAKLHNIFHLIDVSGLCLLSFLGGVDFHSIADCFNAIVGWDYRLEDLFKVGERISNIRQAFNVREGLTPTDFKLPDRVIGRPPLKEGPVANVTVDAETQIREFLIANDWDTRTGKPSKKKLLELGLENVAKDLHSD